MKPYAWLIALAVVVGCVDDETVDDPVGVPILVEEDEDGIRTYEIDHDDFLWPDGVIYYELDTALPEHLVQAVMDGIAAWEAVTSIRFVEALSGQRFFIEFEGDEAVCESPVGFEHGIMLEVIELGDHCSDGNVLHELGHAIGLRHAHERCDRDEHVRIYAENIKQGYLHDFHKYCDPEIQWSDVAPYDPESLMHYGAYFFSSNGEMTVEAISVDPSLMGQRERITERDALEVNYLYRHLEEGSQG